MIGQAKRVVSDNFVLPSTKLLEWITEPYPFQLQTVLHVFGHQDSTPSQLRRRHDQGIPMGKAVPLTQAHGALDGGGIERRDVALGHQGAGVFMCGGAGKTKLLRADIDELIDHLRTDTGPPRQQGFGALGFGRVFRQQVHHDVGVQKNTLSHVRAAPRAQGSCRFSMRRDSGGIR